MCTPVSVSIMYAGSVLAKIMPYIASAAILAIGAALLTITHITHRKTTTKTAKIRTL